MKSVGHRLSICALCSVLCWTAGNALGQRAKDELPNSGKVGEFRPAVPGRTGASSVRNDMSLIAPVRRDAEQIDQFTQEFQQILAEQAQTIKELRKQLEQARIEAIKPVPLPDDARFVAFQLKYASAEEVADTIRKLFGDAATRIAIDKENNRVIVAMSEGRLKELKPLVDQLDQPRAAPEGVNPSSVLKAFQLKYIAPAAAAEAIRGVLGDDKMQWSVVPGTQTLLVHAPEPIVGAVEAILVNVDRPSVNETARPETLQIRWLWFINDPTKTVGVDPSTLVANDQVPNWKVLDALKSMMGFTVPRLVSQQVSTIMKDADGAATFQSNVPVVLNKAVLGFDTHGQLSGRGLYRLELSANVSGSDNSGERRTWTMSSSIAMPLRHFVVMGTTSMLVPGDDPKTYPAALVVRIDEATPLDATPPAPESGTEGRRGQGADKQADPSRPENNPFR